MTVAVKYCGGCNPRYDRAALAARIAGEFPALTLAGADAPGPDLVLVLCGCPNRCAGHEGLTGSAGKLVLASSGEYPALRQAISDCLSPANGREKQKGAELFGLESTL